MCGVSSQSDRGRGHSHEARFAIRLAVTRKLHRYYGDHDLHFITCSCYRRQPLLGLPERRDRFTTILEQTRLKYRFVVHG